MSSNQSYLPFLKFCKTVFAVLKQVICVDFSSDSDTWKVKIQPTKHYDGMRTNDGACISYFVTCINIAKQQQHKIWNLKPKI